MLINVQKLEKYRREDGKFHFFLWYPEEKKGNEWFQVSNPAFDVGANALGVDGYEVGEKYQIQGINHFPQPIDIEWDLKYWGGLEYDNKYALIDGSVNHNNWFYAIGSYVEWNFATPGPGKPVQIVELYAESISQSKDKNLLNIWFDRCRESQGIR